MPCPFSVSGERAGPVTDPMTRVFLTRCPECLVAVVRAVRGDGVVLCDPAPVRLGFLADDTHVVEVSESGAARVVDVAVLPEHCCAPGSIVASEMRAAYPPAVLALSCPAARCGAFSRLPCLSPRGDVLTRPHGARVALSLSAPIR